MREKWHFALLIGALALSFHHKTPALTDPAAPQTVDWPGLIDTASAQRVTPVRAMTVLNTWGSASKPAEFSADDGLTYIVKDSVAKQQCVNDQVVAVLAAALGAPTGRAALVEVSGDLIQGSAFLQQNSWGAGVWHGSLRVGDVSDRESFKYTDVPENRHRFSQLAILYGWAHTRHDHQFLYQNAEPHVVYSVDHGHFFPNGPDWDISHLSTHTDPASPDPIITAACNLTNAELKLAGAALSALDVQDVISRAVASPLDHWTDPGLSSAKRTALAEYLHRRHRELVTAIGQLPS